MRVIEGRSRGNKIIHNPVCILIRSNVVDRIAPIGTGLFTMTRGRRQSPRMETLETRLNCSKFADRGPVDLLPFLPCLYLLLCTMFPSQDGERVHGRQVIDAIVDVVVVCSKMARGSIRIPLGFRMCRDLGEGFKASF